VCVCVFVCEVSHIEEGWLDTHKWVDAKLQEKDHKCDAIIDKWIGAEGLSVDEKSGLIASRVSKQIKIRDDNERLITEPT
jgi:hypothetical protein